VTLPTAMLLNDSQRAIISRHADELNDLCAKTPIEDEDAAKQMLVIITRMQWAQPGQKTSEDGVEAKGDAYMDALDDLPPWAVTAALRRWYRGDCDHVLKTKTVNGRVVVSDPPHNYSFVPPPAMLRRIARGEMWTVKGRAVTLERLLIAKPKREYTEAHCAEMRDRLHAALPWMMFDAE
jgi:hypothetical protein